uniref:Response regulatory domain-containing protein n=1 Tax=Steinernema glaseri TaxID=37863 RepID=A0A1I7YHK1_9BILA
MQRPSPALRRQKAEVYKNSRYPINVDLALESVLPRTFCVTNSIRHLIAFFKKAEYPRKVVLMDLLMDTA